MSLYHALRDYKDKSAELDKALEQFGTDIPNLTDRAQTFSCELRKVQHDKEQGRRLQSHKIENYWSADQIGEFDHLLEVIGFPTRLPQLNEEEIADSIKAGVVYKHRGSIYVIPNLGRRLKTAAIVLSASAVGFGGWSFICSKYFGKGSGLEGLIMGGVVVIAFSPLAIPYIFSNAKNPFEYLASELEKRVEYINANITK